MCLGLLWVILQVTDKQMPILASLMFPNAYGKVGGVAVTTAEPLNSTDNTNDVYVVKYNSLGKSVWAARIGGTGSDLGFSITTDTSGNVYVTGQCNITTAFNADGSPFGVVLPSSSGSNDVFIAKYNSSGTVQWIARLASIQLDIGYGVATDSSGNVYLTGSGGSGAVVTAFNANGTAFATTIPNAGSNDAFVVKYTTDGSVSWVTRIASTGVDTGFGIATDTLGGVYVVGQGGSATVTAYNVGGVGFPGTLTNVGLGDAFIVKYNTDGAVQWTAKVGSTQADLGYAIATDTAGNVYVTGQGGAATVTAFSSGGASFTPTLTNVGLGDAFIVKYNTSGIVQWNAKIASTQADFGRGIATDDAGDVYIIGQGGTGVTFQAFNSNQVAFGTPTANSGSTDAFIVKYSTSGSVAWVARVASSAADIGYSIATDSSGNVYVTGQGGSNATVTAFNADTSAFGTTLPSTGNNDAFIVKYNTSGVVQWVTRLASNNQDIGYSIWVDDNSNVYTTGQFNGGAFSIYGQSVGLFSTTTVSSRDAIIVKYNTSGAPQWVARIASSGVDQPYGIATDNSGNLYVTGSGDAATVTAFNANGSAFPTTLGNTGLGDAFIVKYNSSGVVQWVAKVASTQTDVGFAIATDNSGNVYVTGLGGDGVIVRAFNANGTQFTPGLANSGGSDAFIVKYNTDGAVQWVARVASSVSDTGNGITTDVSGNVYVTGNYGATTATAFSVGGVAFPTPLTNSGGDDAFIVKYNTDGAVQWVARVASTSGDIGNAIATDTSGNVYVTGRGGAATVSVFNADGTTFGTLANAGLGDVFIVKYNTNGAVQWTARVATTQLDIGYAISTDNSGNVYIGGMANTGSAVSVFNANGTTFDTSTTNTGGFVVKYNTSGVAQWVIHFSTSGDTFGLDTDSSGNVYVTVSGGTTLIAYNSDRSEFLTISGNRNGTLLKYDTNGFGVWAQQTTSQVTVNNSPTYRGVSVDSLGNPYICFASAISGTGVFVLRTDTTPYMILNTRGGNDAFIVKYSSNVNPLWVASISSSDNEIGNGIAIDGSGNVYVACQGGVATVTAFNADGTAFGTTLANSGAGDAVLAKYDTNGTVLWVARIATTGSDIAFAIATDTSGNVYVTGRHTGAATVFNANGTSTISIAHTGSGDAFIVKYNTSGVAQWGTRATAGLSQDTGFSVATDDSGNVYVAGAYAGTVNIVNGNGTNAGSLTDTGLGDAFIVKYNTTGTVQWFTKIASTALDIAYGIDADGPGNVYVVGQCGTTSVSTTAFNAGGSSFTPTLPSSGGGDVFIVKYNTSGAVQWVAKLGTNSTTADIGFAVAVDNSGNVYVTGQNPGTMTAFNANGTAFATTTVGFVTDAFVVKYDTNGTVLWIASISTTPGSNDIGYGITTDDSGNVYVVGQGGNGDVVATSSNGVNFGSTVVNAAGKSNESFVVKYDSSGNVQWVSVMSGIGVDQTRGIRVDTSGNIYTTGRFATSALIAYDA